jgi:hypothetical protein
VDGLRGYVTGVPGRVHGAPPGARGEA